jgi:hypothetical protein
MLILYSCKKYEDDNHFITFRKPTIRILGTYELRKIVLNKIDYTDSISQIWGNKTKFEFSDIHFYQFNYSYQSNPIEQLDTRSLIVTLDDQILAEHPYLPKIYRGSYKIANKNEGIMIRLHNPIDLIVAKPDEYINTEIYPRSINYYFYIRKLDRYGLSLARNNGLRINFNRIE